MTGVWGALVEAWAELRIHKMRVLLSLIGVGVAITAMTTVTAIGTVLEEVQTDIMESQGGRPGTVEVSIYPIDESFWSDPYATGQTSAEVATALAEFTERYQIRYASRSTYATLPIAPNGFLRDVGTLVVDQSYGELRNIRPIAGQWFTREDAERLSPPLLINESLLTMLGHETFEGPFALDVYGDNPTTATVIGVMANTWEDEEPTAIMLFDSYQHWVTSGSGELFMDLPSFTMWVDPSQESEAMARAQSDLAVIGGTNYQVDVWPSYYGDSDDYFRVFRLVVGGVGLLILGLAAINLVNIAIVTLKQRVREIGIRRAFGASSGRIFFSVMLESVVATVLAGVVGIMASVIILRNIPTDFFTAGMTTLDVTITFPAGVALFGFIAAAGVGVLSGLVPALMAVRIKPIDAIRY